MDGRAWREREEEEEEEEEERKRKAKDEAYEARIKIRHLQVP